MTTIKKILCAIDLTKASRTAFDRALSIARVSKAKLYVLHAVPANMPFSWRASDRLELLTELRKRAERAGVAVRVVEHMAILRASSCCMQTRGRPTSSFLDPTGDAAGADSGRALSENACCAAPRGQC